MNGRRLPDNAYPEEPGDYSRARIQDKDGTPIEGAWWVKVPTGGPIILIGRPNDDGSPYHHVEENDDGTITVRPNPPGDPTNSNSILWNDWHGYIDSGVWNSV